MLYECYLSNVLKVSCPKLSGTLAPNSPAV